MLQVPLAQLTTEPLAGRSQQEAIWIRQEATHIGREIRQAVALPEQATCGLHGLQTRGISAQGFELGWQAGHGCWGFRQNQLRG
jgi:hypothetical protein